MNYPLTYKQFYEGLKEGKLLGLQCRSCGAYTAPPKICCAECTGTDLEVVELSGRGEIKTFTVIRVAPEGFEAPYIVAMAEMEEGPWLLGNLEGVEPDRAAMDLIGKKVKVGHKVIPPVRYSAGEGVAVTFLLAD
ncbi:Zn-ribbon domain-containing OB-fold protein [Desulfofundulus thermocisternus]|uniref:Zn-ribbon domain-containing OB-fold protein n=1 Tax=Desulfofundulus thermocisternus TaxID=42471 RepID=UPI00217D9C62|nr:Zn-ribbon domain-containing OB-fold protein [Desulfofundulus thermocisternus]MCS5694721.1 Zn-ribbon domain-containing OB-fold protein [Desulfofundulus thermocisternus]